MKKRRAGQRRPDSQVPTGPLSVLIALLSCAFLWPSEGAINGDGLHLSFLWLVALAGVCLWRGWLTAVDGPETTTGLQHRGYWESLSSADGLVATGLTVFLLGTWLSTWHVFRVSGDRRAALNLAFDWTAIAACACLCRMLAVHIASRRAIVSLLVGLGVGVAAYGMWQSQVFYVAEAKAYLEQRHLLEEGASPSEIAQVLQEFSRKGIPLDGAARQIFEHRLLNSTEPFGPFALANTLAGVLAVSLVLLSGGLLSEWKSEDRQWKHLILPLVAFGIMLWCLVLTKSRTAWVGATIGIVVLLLSQNRRRSETSQPGHRSVLRILLMMSVAVVLLFTGGIFSGVIDKEVLLESPRSLQFRFFYWMGAAGVISDEPVFGAGPGNFRQLYLAHKPVESSEAILDPHNFLLDAWCFAGIVGFAGMLLLVSGIVRSTKTTIDQPTEPMTSPAVSVAPGLLGCLLLHFGWLWLSGWMPAGQDIVVVATIVLAGVCSVFVSRLTWNPTATAAAAITLLIHLLGAGGLQITILGFLLVILATLAASQPVSPLQVLEQHRTPRTQTATAVAVASMTVASMAAATLFWGLVPVVGARLEQGIGQQRLRVGDINGALHAFELAAEADPLSPTMRQHFVQAVTYSLMQQDSRKTPDEASDWPQEEIDAIESACAEFIQADSRLIASRLIRGRIYRQLYRLTNQSRYIELCVSDLRQAVMQHPTNAGFQTELAIAEQEAGEADNALKSAKRAKEIEFVNQRWGHSDQYLSAEDLKTIDRIINGESK